jgi:hypothetical protein
MAKRRMTDQDRAYLERTRLERLREDYLELTMGQRVEQQATLSETLTEIRATFAKRR